ncbi:MAG: ATP-binding cassette domain-containing protein [Gammaproteobacteria bacterium]|nr:ATP-binding cassette domain-containing protein [Gammaproteobacteria bacterium]
MLTFNEVTLRRGSEPLFEHASFRIHATDKVGLTGANGTGKSSLFALIMGKLSVDSGDFSLPQKWVISHVAQETPAVDIAAIDYVMDGDKELRHIQHEISQAEQSSDGSRQATLLHQLEAVDGYTARTRAAQLMNGLGFTTAQEENPVSSFSGGWRMRLNLAQALMCRSDLLLLDEPTNHLDLDAVLWLEEWLRRYPGTMLLISHDRDFLDRCINHVAHIEHQKITLYRGNYSSFERRRAESLAQQQSAFVKQQREIAHIRSYVDRFRAQATKARQAQSRLKALERMEEIAPAHVDSPFHFAFSKPEQVPNPLLQLHEATASYGDKIIIKEADFNLVPGDRIGLLGPNGAGKSTLIKLLVGDMKPSSGRYKAADQLKIGYFAQHQLEQLHDDDSPIEHLQPLNPTATEQSLKNFLGGFGFSGEKALSPVAPFSGGEKARLVLALLVYQKPNLLLLDEPTNHLDLEMRHALTLALQTYEGAMVIISHDRHLLRTVTDQLFIVCDGHVESFDGDLDDYRQWLANRKTTMAEQSKNSLPEQNNTINRKEQRKQEAEKRKQLQPLRNKLKKLEKSLESLEQEKNDIEQQLSSPAIYEEKNKQQLKELLLSQSKIKEALEETEEAWMEVSETLSSAEPSPES